MSFPPRSNPSQSNHNDKEIEQSSQKGFVRMNRHAIDLYIRRPTISDRSTALIQFLVQFASFGGRHQSQKKCRGMIRATRKKILYEQIRELTNRHAWTDPKLRKSLRELEDHGLIKCIEENGWFCISVIHYEEFVASKPDSRKTQFNSATRAKRPTASSESDDRAFEDELAPGKKPSKCQPKPLSKEGLKNGQLKVINGGSAEPPPTFELVRQGFEARFLKGDKCAHFATAREFFNHKRLKGWRFTTVLEDDIDHWLEYGKANKLISESDEFNPRSFLDTECASSSSMSRELSVGSQNCPSLEEVRTFAKKHWGGVLSACELQAQRWYWRQSDKNWIHRDENQTHCVADAWDSHLGAHLDAISNPPPSSTPQ